MLTEARSTSAHNPHRIRLATRPRPCLNHLRRTLALPKPQRQWILFSPLHADVRHAWIGVPDSTGTARGDVAPRGGGAVAPEQGGDAGNVQGDGRAEGKREGEVWCYRGRSG